MLVWHSRVVLTLVLYLESTLDVQYIMAMAPGVATSFFVVDG